MADTAPEPLRALKPDEKKRTERRAPKADTQPRRPSPSGGGRKAPLKDRTEQFIGGIALAVSVFDAGDGLIIMESAPDMAEAWAELANQNPRVRATMERVLTGGAWGAIVMVHGSVALRIAQNHGIIGELTFPIGPKSEGDNDPGPAGEPSGPGSDAKPSSGVPPTSRTRDHFRVNHRG